MFVGHLAVAFAARRLEPTLSLGWLLAGATALDLLWPIFLLAGLESVRIVPGATAFTPLIFDSYPWSHSLLMSVVWGAALAGVVRAAGGIGSPVLIAGLVVSHWVLDFASHAPDMPLWPGPSPRLGLGLWDSIPATYLVEGALWIAGLTLYLRGRRAMSVGGAIGLWSLVVICTALWTAGPWGPAPPSPQGLAWFAVAGWVIPFWGALADRRYAAP